MANISLLTALVFCQKRAAKAVFKQFGLFRPALEILHSVAYVISVTGRTGVGETIVLNSIGVNSRDRQKTRRHYPTLLDKGYLRQFKGRNGGQVVEVTDAGQSVLDFHSDQFYTILQAGEIKYKKRLKYGYLEQLPDLKK